MFLFSFIFNCSECFPWTTLEPHKRMGFNFGIYLENVNAMLQYVTLHVHVHGIFNVIRLSVTRDEI